MRPFSTRTLIASAYWKTLCFPLSPPILLLMFGNTSTTPRFKIPPPPLLYLAGYMWPVEKVERLSRNINISQILKLYDIYPRYKYAAQQSIL